MWIDGWTPSYGDLNVSMLKCGRTLMILVTSANLCVIPLCMRILHVCFKICSLVCKPPSNISWQLANVDLIGSLSRFVDQWLNSFVWRPQPCSIDTQMRKNFDNFRYIWKLVCDTFLYEDITYVCSKKYYLVWLGLTSVFFLSNDSLIWIFETLVFVCQ